MDHTKPLTKDQMAYEQAKRHYSQLDNTGKISYLQTYIKTLPSPDCIHALQIIRQIDKLKQTKQ